MDSFEKRDHYINLFDFYENILTKKQQQYFKEYYFDDLSLSEIANNYQISRNAIYDQLQKIHKNLDAYEEKLGLHSKFIERNKKNGSYGRFSKT